ncbi:MAG: hypothetical protein ACM357_04345 [Gemmatimonadota bacterium]|jgi:hypothetical protein
MEGIFAIVFLFGGASLIGFSFTPLGRALADRIRHGATPHAQPDPVLYDELERVRHELGELQERVDFTERLLADRESARELKP